MDPVTPGLEDKTTRLVGWQVQQLLQLIRQIVARRKAVSLTKETSSSFTKNGFHNRIGAVGGGQRLPLDEVVEIIALPAFDARVARKQQDPDLVVLSDAVHDQLTHYVTAVASMYRDNPFHNFAHCSHVSMSVLKLMARIVAPSEDLLEDDLDHDRATKKKIAMTLHDHTYGITSDPLTQFACVFSALIHDVDHTGVPNTQLLKENSQLSNFYGNRSVAEQNSLDIAWNLLMEDGYGDLRGVLFPTGAERTRFRQLIVNSVMATDIVDKELKNLRNARWAKAFKAPAEQPVQSLASIRDAVNRKATIVIEHLIQASDVSHTMQHWHVYRQWNERLFREMWFAWKEGRAEKNPAEFWAKGEIGFFDFYIIPLAKKLKDCGVFGKSSDEYLSYALSNRHEWENRGDAVVAEMVEKLTKLDAASKSSGGRARSLSSTASSGDQLDTGAWSTDESTNTMASASQAEAETSAGSREPMQVEV